MNELKIKLVDKNADLSKIKPYLWDVNIKGIPYLVADIPGYIHTIGGQYGANSYWAWPRYEEPNYENLIQYDGILGARWGFNINSNNFIRNKHDVEVMHNYRVIITRNDEEFYSFSCRDIGYASAKALITICDFREHPISLNEINFQNNIVGRKVYWKESPGIITRYIDKQACVIIEPDGIDRFPTPVYYDDNEWMEPDIKADILDNHIWWFRD